MLKYFKSLDLFPVVYFLSFIAMSFVTVFELVDLALRGHETLANLASIAFMLLAGVMFFVLWHWSEQATETTE